MAKIENKKSWIDVEIKAVDASDEYPNGSFEVIASTDDLDRDGEVVDYGALNPLPEYVSAITDHEAECDNVVGWGTPTYENGVLVIRGPFDADERSQIIREKVKSKSIRKVSIGFMNAKRERKDNAVHITSAELLEVSFVVIPSNRGADVVSAKAYASVEPPEGSFEDVQEDVTEALYGYYGDEAYVCLIATFPDHVVYAVRHWPEQAQDGTYSMPFELDANGVDGATFTADPTSVEITQVISEKRAHMSTYLKEWAANIDERKAGRTEYITKNFGAKSAIDEVAEDLVSIEAELVDMELDDDDEWPQHLSDGFSEIDDLDRELEGLISEDEGDDAESQFRDLDVALADIANFVGSGDDIDGVSPTA